MNMIMIMIMMVMFTGNILKYTNNYSYNSLGNRTYLEYNENGVDTYRTYYEYDKNNRLLNENKTVYNNQGSAIDHYSITEYSYDKNGNQISKAKYNQNVENKFTVSINDINTDDSVGYEVFTYDRLNEIIGYKNSKGTTAAYKYLPNHYRMSKTVDGVLTQQIWDGDNIVAEANDANAILRSYTWGHQLLTDDDRRAYMYDGHGNIVQQNRGTTAESITRYDAYGNKVESSNVNDVPFGYCGEYLDSESGLIYLRNRYYDSESGRFITEDPIRDGINWYAYCSGNPVMFEDYIGLRTEEDKNLSTNAQVYIDYYTQQWIDLNEQYEYAETETERVDILKKMTDVHENANDIREKDKEGLVTGKVYDVPLFIQGRLNLCWAFCQIMVECWKSGEEIIQATASSRAYYLANNLNGGGINNNGQLNWNNGNWPTNSIDVINGVPNLQMINSMDDLKQLLSSAPVYVYYSNMGENAHLVVGRGYVSAEGHDDLVVTNNPWGG